MAAVESIGVSCGHRVPREPIHDGVRKLYWCAECDAYRMSGGHSTGERTHDWALQLREVVALEGADGRPLTITVEKPLSAHGQRLADALGVRVEVKPVTSIVISGRNMGQYIVPGPSFAKPDGPRADWIDYRASIASVHRREQNGDEALTCSDCGTETDVTDVVHSPNCKTLAPPVQKKASAWTADEAIAALKAHAVTHGETPSLDDWRAASPGRPTQAVIVRLFGTWLDGVRAAGLEPRRRGRPKRTADADAHEEAAAVLREIRELHSARGEEIESSDGQGAHPRMDSLSDATATTEATLPSPESDDPPSAAVRSRVGVGPAVRWTSEIIVGLVRLWADQHDGEPPIAKDWQSGDRSWPSVASCIRQFGSFANAIEAAGFEKPTRGRRRAKAAAPEERGTRRTVGAGSGPRSSDAEVVEAPPRPAKPRAATRGARCRQRVLRRVRGGGHVRLRDWFDLEQPVERPRDVLLHPLYGSDRAHDRAPVAVEVDLVAHTRCERVLALAKVAARRVTQLIAEPHDRNLTSRTPW